MAQPWIVVVDDERDIVESVTELLRLALPHARIMGTVSTTEALSLAREGIDVLVTDFRMPIMDGLELSQKALQADRGIAIILFTAYAEEDLVERAEAAGIKTVVRKPLDPAKFVDVVQAHLPV